MFFMSIMFLVISYSLFKILLDLHQIKYIKSTHISDDELRVINLTQEYAEKSKLYNTEKLYISIFNTLIQSFIIIAFLSFDGISILAKATDIINVFAFNPEVINMILFIIFLTLMGLPVSYYKNFISSKKSETK